MYIPKYDDTIGRSLFHYGEWTQSEITVIGQLVRPGTVVADIGANIGTHSLAMSKMVGPDGLVVAVEPMPFAFPLLSANLLINGCQNVVAINAGASNKNGWIDVPEILYEIPANFGAISMEGRTSELSSVSARAPVPQIRLDDIPALRNAGLIKIDAEGMERSVLAGAREVIARNRPILYVENENPGEKSEALINSLLDLDYSLYWDIAHVFSEDNMFKNENDIFDNRVCVNMLCVATDRPSNISNFRQVQDPKEHPRSPT